MVMLYDQPQNLDSLTNIGCETMFFGWEWDELEDILQEMKTERLISYSAGKWHLESKAKFYIKKKSLLPILKITENHDILEDFKTFAHDQCNTDFLDQISDEPDETTKVRRIKNFAEQNYEKMVHTGVWAVKFLITTSSG